MKRILFCCLFFLTVSSAYAFPPVNVNVARITAWTSGIVYSVGDSVDNDGGIYACTAAHGATSGTEPGTGASWASYWRLQSSAAGAESDPVYIADPAFSITNAGSGIVISDAERTKLTGIEEAADVTDATNVAAAGARMTSSENAGTDVTADLEEETHASEHAVAGGDTVFPADPGADRFLMWDDDPGELVWAEGAGDVTQVGDGETGAVFTADGTGNSLYFEGSSADAIETILTATDPTTADKTITLPDETLTVVGSTSALGTDNVLVKADGTGQKVQATGIAVDDSNNVSGIVSIVLEGGANDTTLQAGTPTGTVTYTLPAADGLDGQYLKTDGSGGLSFGDPSGSGDVTGVGDGASGEVFTENGSGNVLYFEGTTANTYEIALTGANPAADVTLTLPAATDTLVGRATTDTLTNKTLTSPTITGASSTGVTSFTAANDLDIGAHEFRAETFESDVTTGTAPFTIASTTVSTNLNADLLDGESASAFQDADTDLATLATPTAWRLFYSDGSQNVQEVALGANGTFFEANGATAAPAFRALEPGDIPDISGTYEAVDAEILRADTADTISADMEFQDNIPVSFGNDNDWEIDWDTDISDVADVDSSLTGAALVISTANAAADGKVVFENTDGTYGVDLYVKDIHYSGSLAWHGTGDSFLQLANNSGGLAPSGYRLYFETDGSDVLSYSVNGSEKRVANLGDAQTISGVKTFSERQVLQGDADIGDASNAGSLRLYDGSSNYIDLQTEALTANRTWQLPDSYGSSNQALLSDGDGTFTWGNPSAAPAGSDTQVQFNDSSSTGADAGFLFNKTTNALTIGEDGQDGSIILYNESGGTDYNLTLQPGTQTGAATITFPGSTGTLATIGNAETISGAKGFSSAPFSSVANATALGTTSGEWADLYLGDAAVITLGNDQDVTLTHVADTGVLLNSTSQFQFRDSAIYINSGADGYLDLEADTGIRFNGPVTFANEGAINLGAVGTATTPAENDNDTSVATTAYVQTEISGFGTGDVSKDADQDIWQSVAISPSALIADGTNCTYPDSEAINSGPNVWFSTCSDAAGTLEIGIPMPENWDGGNIYVELVAGSNEASPSGTVEFEVQAMARGNDDIINSTWLTTVDLQFGANIDTQYDVVTAESAVIACSGAGGDMLFIKVTRDNDDGTNDTSTQAVEIWGMRVYYQIDDLDERD